MQTEITSRGEKAASLSGGHKSSLSREVFLTKDYDQFDFYPQNRNPTASHIRRMRNSLEEFGFLREHPITVVKEDGKLKITDGQHRFLAALELDIPVYYTLSSSSDVAQDIVIEHLYSKAWIIEDFLHHHVSLGVPSYLEIKDFCATYHVHIMIALNLLQPQGKTTQRDIAHFFKVGGFVIEKERLQRAKEIMEKVNEIRFYHANIAKLKNDRSFINAMVKVVQTVGYHHEGMLKNTERALMNFVKCSNVDDYLRMITDIYNFRRREENYLIFKK